MESWKVSHSQIKQEVDTMDSKNLQKVKKLLEEMKEAKKYPSNTNEFINLNWKQRSPNPVVSFFM